MRSWDEFVGFVRGTRPRPPPGPSQPVVTALLAVAAVLHLPLAYLAVAAIELAPAFTILVGLLAMGLTWCAGVSLEGRRIGTVRGIAIAGTLEGGLALLPAVAAALGSARWLLLLSALLCGLALVKLARVPRPQRPPKPQP